MTKGPPRTLSFDQLVQSSGGTPGPTTWRQRPFKTFVSQNLGDSLVVSKAWLSKRQVPQDIGDFSRNVDGDCCRHLEASTKHQTKHQSSSANARETGLPSQGLGVHLVSASAGQACTAH